MEYNMLLSDFLDLFPEDREQLQSNAKQLDIDETDGMHVAFGMIVVPYVKSLLRTNNNETKIRKAFDFFEEMAISGDALVCEVLEFTVLEDFISQGNIFLNLCKRYMGKQTLESCLSVERYMM